MGQSLRSTDFSGGRVPQSERAAQSFLQFSSFFGETTPFPVSLPSCLGWHQKQSRRPLRGGNEREFFWKIVPPQTGNNYCQICAKLSNCMSCGRNCYQVGMAQFSAKFIVMFKEEKSFDFIQRQTLTYPVTPGYCYHPLFPPSKPMQERLIDKR